MNQKSNFCIHQYDAHKRNKRESEVLLTKSSFSVLLIEPIQNDSIPKALVSNHEVVLTNVLNILTMIQNHVHTILVKDTNIPCNSSGFDSVSIHHIGDMMRFQAIRNGYFSDCREFTCL